MLRLENGRCVHADLAACSSVYYDPDRVCFVPSLTSELDYHGEPSTCGDAIPSSVGMDLVEVRLNPVGAY
jgi:hypothetical protein